MNKYAIISTDLVCVMWPNYPGANGMGMTWQACWCIVKEGDEKYLLMVLFI